MKKIVFNRKWELSNQPGKSIVEAMMSSDEQKKEICLPYDAMICEKVTAETKNAGQTGYYPGKIYYYTKDFDVPEDWEEKTVILEFEGIYGQTMIYINGDYAGNHKYGYTSCFIIADDFLKYGETNHIEVVVNNEGERNSRWYSGSGIYRDVQIHIGNKIHIPIDGIQISTPEVEKKLSVITTNIKITNQDNKKHKVRVITEIIDSTGEVVSVRNTPVTLYKQSDEIVEQRIMVRDAKLWDCDSPNLYQCHVVIQEEEKKWEDVTENFGIRKLQLDPENGLRINEKEVKLRGTCIHHDHGIIGASAFVKAEERKVKLLKEAGFNCIRIAHHPAGKLLLDVCDRYGMLVMDELSDMWTKTKNINDFANDFELQWEELTKAMIRKDYNHPSVILYSMGNEIQEAGSAKGAQINRKIHQKIKSMDATRYTTNGINGTIATGERFMEIVGSVMQQMGIPIPQMDVETQTNQTQGGSDALNSMMSIMVGPLADAIANHPIMSEMTEEFVEAMDVAGYNYLTGRHASEHDKYPNRVVLGTETFPADIANLWKIVEQNHHVIGDMTWTGLDYLGEAGVGIFHYDGGINFQAQFPERAAYIGDLDLIGNRRPISYYREIIYGLRKVPYIGVERVNRYGQQVGRTPWMWKDNIASWTWPGYEGKPAIIDVMSDAEEVELFLNGISQGIKPAGRDNDYLAEYEITYETGELKAVAIRNGKKQEEFVLQTAMNDVKLAIDVDQTTLQANGNDLSYISIHFEDENHIPNLNIQKKVSIQVSGAGTLEGFGSANPSCTDSYQDTEWDTYDGYVMAVIRSGFNAGEIDITISAEECKEEKIKIQVV